MRKIILTSAGFENKKLENIFLELVGKAPNIIKALFVPTAANNADAIAVLPNCMDDLLNAGLLKKNITVYDLHKKLEYIDLQQYDTIYFCGGSTEYLLDRINDTGFDISLRQFVDNGGVYIGVSAGSCIAVNNLQNNLGFLNCTISVHTEVGSNVGTINTEKCPHIDLTNNQAILIINESAKVIE